MDYRVVNLAFCKNCKWWEPLDILDDFNQEYGLCLHPETEFKQKGIAVGRFFSCECYEENSSGKKITHFTVAVNRKRGDAEETDWFDVASSVDLRTLCLVLDKGNDSYMESIKELL